MYLSSIRLVNFRNFPELSVSFPSQGAHLAGPNASGKTNLFEAIHLLCTGRSQRLASRTEMVRFGAEECYVEGIFCDESGTRKQAGIGFSRDGRIIMDLDGKRISQLSQWFGIAPVIPCGPDDLEIVGGAPGLRRRFLDMLLSQVDTEYLEHLMSYQEALRNRNRLLSLRVQDEQISIYEELMAVHGEYLVVKRSEAVGTLKGAFTAIYAGISDGRETAEIAYHPSFAPVSGTEDRWKDVYLKSIYTSRGRDMDTGFSARGPHRDDIRISIDQRGVRQFGSQGQRRSIMISLRLCSVTFLEQARNGPMILLFDDIFSELDAKRIDNILSLIENKGQVFTASPFPCGPSTTGRAQLSTRNGTITA